MSSRALSAVVVAAFLGIFSPLRVHAASTEDEAGDISEVDKDRTGPLKDRIRPVSGHLFLKKGRFELSPAVGVTLKDAFFTKYLFGLSATYHLSETFALGLHGALAVPVVSGAAQICVQGAGGLLTCGPPTYAKLNGKAPGNMTLNGGLDLQWAPIYGKIGLSGEAFAHFDFYGILGLAAVQYNGPPLAGGIGSLPATTVGGNVGIGMRFFFNRWLTLRTEVRDLIYVENAAPAPSTVTSLRNQLLFEVGFSMFFPTTFQEQ